MGMICVICLTMSCSSDKAQDSGYEPIQEGVPTDGSRAIGFIAAMADDGSGSEASVRRTRGVGDGELTTADLQAVGFGVFCWYTEGNNFSSPASAKYMLMRNQKVVYNGTLAHPWFYSHTKYWPLEASHKLTFRAYAPYVDYSLVEKTEAVYSTYTMGMPLLPVVVAPTDYKLGTQHDPLWGTGRLVQGEDDAVPGEYVAGDHPRYGHLHNDVTYKSSGDKRLESDTNDGIVDWYFHHGMSSLMLNISVVKDPGCDKVTIKRIVIEPLYTQGLLDISSPTATKDEKPWWYDRSGTMTVMLDDAPCPVEIETNRDLTKPTDPVPVLSKGLLIIPRSYDFITPMSMKIVYTIDDDPDELEALGSITGSFEGNTSYTLDLMLTPETRGVEIQVVQSAFTRWTEGDSGDHTVHNW